MAAKRQPHVLYTHARREPGAPWRKRGIWQSWGAAERQHQIGEAFVVLPVQPGETWPETLATGDELDTYYLTPVNARQVAS